MRTPEKLAAEIVGHPGSMVSEAMLEGLIAAAIYKAVAVYQIKLAQQVEEAHEAGELEEEATTINYILSLVEADPWKNEEETNK